MAKSIETRLTKLESHVAHLERLVEELNGVVVDQGKLLARLQTQVQKNSRVLQSLEVDRIRENNTKPPHYQ